MTDKKIYGRKFNSHQSGALDEVALARQLWVLVVVVVVVVGNEIHRLLSPPKSTQDSKFRPIQWRQFSNKHL